MINNFIKCSICDRIRDALLTKCEDCGSDLYESIDRMDGVFTDIDLEIIIEGAKYYDHLTDRQKAYLSSLVPLVSSWEFYAGMFTFSRVSIIWLRYVLPFKDYADPMSIINSRILYIMSLKPKSEQESFCKLLNLIGDEGREYGIQGEVIENTNGNLPI